MRQPPHPSRTMRHIERAADNATPIPGLRLPCPAAVSGRDLPGRVIRRRGDDGDPVPASRKPGGHLAGIFADTRELRCEIEADDQNMHDHVADAARSVRVLARPPDPKAHQQDLEVEPHRPALDIFEIIDDAKPRLVEVIDLAALPMDLGPTGYARLYPVPVEILFDGVIIK